VAPALGERLLIFIDSDVCPLTDAGASVVAISDYPALRALTSSEE
jgi:hypothetical protein